MRENERKRKRERERGYEKERKKRESGIVSIKHRFLGNRTKTIWNLERKSQMLMCSEID